VKLGIYVSPRTVCVYWPPEPEPRGDGRTSSQNWRTFVRNHAQSIVACDFLVVVTARFRTRTVFLLMEVGTRRIVHCNVTAHPTATWTLQQLREAIPSDHSYRFFIHDRDAIFSAEVDRQTFLRPRLQGRGSRSARRSPSRIPGGKDRGVKERRSSVDTPLCLRLPNFWWLYGWDCRCLSFATRRTSWGKNSLVPIGTKFISCTGSNPTITASFCQTTIYI
jgi:hypothetical protein